MNGPGGDGGCWMDDFDEDRRHVHDDRQPQREQPWSLRLAGRSDGCWPRQAACSVRRFGIRRSARYSGNGYISQPSTIADTMNVPNSLAPNTDLRARIVFRQERKDERDEEREERQQNDVAVHHLRPTAMSYASMTTSRLSSAATTIYVLPYS